MDSEGYLALHPEIKMLITLFTQEVIHHQPTDLRQFGSAFFGNQDVQNYVARQFGFQVPAAHIQSQVNYQLLKLQQSQALQQIDQQKLKMQEIVNQLQQEVTDKNPQILQQLKEASINDSAQNPEDIARSLQSALTDKDLEKNNSSCFFLEPQPDIVLQEQINDFNIQRVKITQLAEFAMKTLDLQHLQDLGNVFLFFQPLKSQLYDPDALAVRLIIQCAFPRALSIQVANSVGFSRMHNYELFQTHVHGIGIQELLHLNALLQNMNSLFIGTNIKIDLQKVTKTELVYFHGTGKGFQYLRSRNNYYYQRFYKYLPVLFKANYHQKEVTNFCTVLVSFIPPCCYNEAVAEQAFQPIAQGDSDATTSRQLEDIAFNQYEVQPINAQQYEAIKQQVYQDLRELDVEILLENIKFVNLSLQQLVNYGYQECEILHSFVDISTYYQDLNKEFYFKNVINCMDDRTIKDYDFVKREQLKIPQSCVCEQVYGQLASFKNMKFEHFDQQALKLLKISQSNIKNMTLVEPLSYYLQQCLQLTNSTFNEEHFSSFKLLQDVFVRPLTLNINCDPVLQYIANILHQQCLQHFGCLQSVSKTSSLPAILQIFTSSTLTGDGPLYECTDMYHSFNCGDYCMVNQQNLNRGQIYVGKIQKRFMQYFLPGIVNFGQIFLITTQLTTLLKALIFYYQYHFFNQTFISSPSQFYYFVGFGFYYDKANPDSSLIFDANLYRQRILSQFQYNNVDGNLISNIFQHQQLYQQAQVDLCKRCAITANPVIQLVLDEKSFNGGVGSILQRFTNAQRIYIGNMRDSFSEELKDGWHAGQDVDLCYPTSFVCDDNGREHCQLICKGVGRMKETTLQGAL